MRRNPKQGISERKGPAGTPALRTARLVGAWSVCAALAFGAMGLVAVANGQNFVSATAVRGGWFSSALNTNGRASAMSVQQRNNNTSSASAQNASGGAAATAAQNNKGGAVSSNGASSDDMPRGEKLVLKDGTFQLVREYKVDGDRVSYYSLDTHQWEEMPAALIDWDATKKEAATEAKQDAALLNAVDAREKAEHAEVLSVDASIEPAPGLFLPPDNGLFAFDGKAITVVKQAEMKSTLSKAKTIEKVLIPVPIVPTRHMISIDGVRAKLRFANGQPEFYMRTDALGDQPEIDLVRAKIVKGVRQVENVDELMGETAENRKEIALQRWQIADNVYRYTIAKPLAPGEYVLVESVPGDQYSIYLWDFGIDGTRK